MTTEASTRTGRRPGNGSTREDILSAARARFASNGYDGATLRAIAKDAGVDAGLIRHFFGDKNGLFAATLQLHKDVAQSLLDVFRTDRDGMGERLARRYLSLWDDPISGATLIALLRTALGHDEAMNRLRQFLVEAVVTEAAPLLDADRPDVRINLALATLLGIAIARYIILTPPLAAASLNEVIEDVTPTLQRFLFGSLPELK